jgi:hypothetical protein
MVPHTDTVALLERFPGPVTLYLSPNKLLLVLAGCSVLAFGAALIVRDGHIVGWYGHMIVWLGLVFFAACALKAALALLLPNVGALTLDRGGFEFVGLFRRFRTRWQDTSGFVARRIHPPHLIRGVLYNDAAVGSRLIGKLNDALMGHTSGLMPFYEVSVDELAWLMTMWRERALAGK